ncbi:MAG: hypothetical protein EBY61_07465, partial [Actinobacteria bacterium]|nr:hypothetical protein [Actinomycetota bacterium]
QLFEPRYLALAEHLHGEVEADFGIVGIERGREVGGDDVRADVGVVARVLEMSSLPDGRVSIVAVGTRRVRVDDWLDDAPYPRAMVTERQRLHDHRRTPRVARRPRGERPVGCFLRHDGQGWDG